MSNRYYMLVLYIQQRDSAGSPGDTEVISWDSPLSPSNTSSTLTCMWCGQHNCKLPILIISRLRHQETCRIIRSWDLLNTLNYVSLPHPPAASFTVLFLEWQIRKLFILNDSWGKNQVANFPETLEAVLTDRGWRPRVIFLKRHDLKVIL